jgi:very-short-patch-repair endonuclease
VEWPRFAAKGVRLQHIFNRSRELEKRRTLRANMTGEEKILWEKLRSKKLGFKFKRQYSIGPYVVNFYCSAKKIAIEVDGEVHSTNTAIEYDKEREEFIKSFGIKTIRFSNEEVRGNLHKVLKTIEEAI